MFAVLLFHGSSSNRRCLLSATVSQCSINSFISTLIIYFIMKHTGIAICVLLACTSSLLHCQARPLPDLQEWLGLGKKKPSKEGRGTYSDMQTCYDTLKCLQVLRLFKSWQTLPAFELSVLTAAIKLLQTYQNIHRSAFNIFHSIFECIQ